MSEQDLSTPAVSAFGRSEVEQTLRLARNAMERAIARYRVGAFALTIVATSIIHFITHATWLIPIYFVGCLLYSLVLRLVVGRVGAQTWVVLVTLVLDLSASAGTFLMTRWFGIARDASRAPEFAAFILGPALMLIIFINSLRYFGAASIVGGAGAVTIYLVVMRALGQTSPAMIATSTIFAITAVVGFVATAETRKNLDRFARLSLLRRYLPEAAVDRVLEEDPDASTALGGRLLTVTLLAADLRGFTAMSEDLAPAEVVRQLNAYHGAMIAVIDRHGGAIDKFIGDGTLVVFGFDAATSVGANAAVACARDMLVALDALNAVRAESALPALKMGIGVHTGPVIAGNIGAPGRRLEFTVIGDAVNTASRLEGLTKGLSIPVVVSGATVAELTSKDGLRELAPVSVRGKQRALSVFGLADQAPANEVTY